MERVNQFIGHRLGMVGLMLSGSGKALICFMVSPSDVLLGQLQLYWVAEHQGEQGDRDSNQHVASSQLLDFIGKSAHKIQAQ